ncbi:hypothetical protein Tco_0921496 [Tanacetum coccineum]
MFHGHHVFTGDANCAVPVNDTFHEQKNDELTKKELKQLRVQQMMKGSDIGIQEKKAKLFNEWERFTSTDGESIESYYHRFSKLMNDFKRNKYFLEKIASNLKFLNNLQPEWSRHVTIVHQTKDLHTNRLHSVVDFPPDVHKQEMVEGNGGNQNAVQNLDVQNVGNQNGLIVVPGIANQNLNGNGNVVAARAEGNTIGNNGNQIRYYNYIGLGHLARNYTVRLSSYTSGHFEVSELAACLEKLHFPALLVMSKFIRICFSFVILEVPLSEYFGIDMNYASNLL